MDRIVIFVTNFLRIRHKIWGWEWREPYSIKFITQQIIFQIPEDADESAAMVVDQNLIKKYFSWFSCYLVRCKRFILRAILDRRLSSALGAIGVIIETIPGIVEFYVEQAALQRVLMILVQFQLHVNCGVPFMRNTASYSYCKDSWKTIQAQVKLLKRRKIQTKEKNVFVLAWSLEKLNNDLMITLNNYKSEMNLVNQRSYNEKTNFIFML